MKSLKWRNIQSLSKSSSIHQLKAQKTPQSFLAYFSCTPKPIENNRMLGLTSTQDELTKINLLIPRLCVSNHQSTAIELFTTALMANPNPKSLSISILIHSLTLQSDMKLSMSLLTRLKHAPESHSSLPPITALLISSYLKQGKPENALKVYNWVMRPDSPILLEKTVYGVLVGEFCRIGLVLEALMVLRGMVKANLKPGERLRERIFCSLLREARIKEARELKEALCGFGDINDRMQKVLDLLDHFIRNWTE